MVLKMIVLLVLLSVQTAVARRGRSQEDESETQQLLQSLQEARSTYTSQVAALQRVTDLRWSQRQKQVDQKSSWQREANRTQNEIERLYTEIARIREEILLREGGVSGAESELKREREGFEAISRTVESIIEREEDAVRTNFALDQQERSLEVQQIATSRSTTPAQLQRRLRLLQQYVLGRVANQSSIEITKSTILLNDNSLDEGTVLRFGNVFALAVNDTGDVYYHGFTGQRAESPFEWVKLTDEDAEKNMITYAPTWLKNGRVDGRVYMDVMQNTHTGELLGVQRKTLMQAAEDYIRAGGILMIPLAAICLWALLLILNRLIVYSLTHSRDNKFIDNAVDYLNDKKMNEATDLANRSKGVLARILNTCLHHSKWKRPVAEKAVKELLLDEVPSLDKHLDTLAVLAAAAPLLGLLGTVTGMISMFESITRFGTGDPKLLAGGISEALVTTKTGLGIAIPLLLIHNFLRNRRNHIQSEMEVYAMRILNRLWPQD
ncbi:MotA/TolQ/ExbB proton channel family protein [Chitinispirillales bacterium ANBcel5]|uniref:MotA/TolQ/ExbB proton channel family protein n=1 Tax=Cellulosispirillum alkaliphilum TaxID=3039283 RepID=UPI002A5812EC|nr:MotA/TolQ/ExbB proton channel family protein [Chitinispirillales bacterium ANBcel5]